MPHPGQQINSTWLRLNRDRALWAMLAQWAYEDICDVICGICGPDVCCLTTLQQMLFPTGGLVVRFALCSQLHEEIHAHKGSGLLKVVERS